MRLIRSPYSSDSRLCGRTLVSGDFYYFTKSNGKIFIAAADCTGHGVPGALMSMLGSEKLNEAIRASNDISEVLMRLNKGIKVSLRQSDDDESTRDGMDIALCSIDPENKMVRFGGANRPFWLIRNTADEVEEIKATRAAIGGLTADDQHFDQHEMKLQKGDTFYLCSDGYADQFNEQDKKLTSGRFKSILLEIQNKSMDDQEEYLRTFIESWIGNTEQIDDILVVGIRL